jgi:hypothetical protein
MKNGMPENLGLLIAAWKAPQTGLPTVVRWGKYLKDPQLARSQNSLQHSLAITILGSMVIGLLERYNDHGVRINRGLLMTAFAIHDIGEGEIGATTDTLYIDKNEEQDHKEYIAFCNRYEPLGKTMFEPLHEAFLLQFALKAPLCFPTRARHIMLELASENFLEANIFDAVERWDYVLYALEQYHERGNEKILVQVLRGQIPHLDRLADKVPGLRQTVWTDDVGLWATNFIKAYEGQWVEQKGEK